MKTLLERMMGRWGMLLYWHHEGKREPVRGFFQPVTTRSWQKLKREITPLGEAPTGMYVYMGPADREIQEGDQLEVAGRFYIFRKTELIFDRNGPVYQWGLCARKGREME